MSDKKTCRRFKRTNAGRRCAKYESGSYSKRHGQRSCVKFKTGSSGKRCAKYGEKE